MSGGGARPTAPARSRPGAAWKPVPQWTPSLSRAGSWSQVTSRIGPLPGPSPKDTAAMTDRPGSGVRWGQPDCRGPARGPAGATQCLHLVPWGRSCDSVREGSQSCTPGWLTGGRGCKGESSGLSCRSRSRLSTRRALVEPGRSRPADTSHVGGGSSVANARSFLTNNSTRPTQGPRLSLGPLVGANGAAGYQPEVGAPAQPRQGSARSLQTRDDERRVRAHVGSRHGPSHRVDGARAPPDARPRPRRPQTTVPSPVFTRGVGRVPCGSRSRIPDLGRAPRCPRTP